MPKVSRLRLRVATTNREEAQVYRDAGLRLGRRKTELLTPSHGHDSPTKIALDLYFAYNAAAAIFSVPGGPLGDKKSNLRVFALGVTSSSAPTSYSLSSSPPRSRSRSPDCFRP